MTLDEAKKNFINTWGTMSNSWGINRTMAQIHGLLLVSSKALTTDEIMEALSISRGNVNMNVRSLVDWGLVSKELKIGERKDFYAADKDPWSMSIKIAQVRKQRELEPMLELFQSTRKIEYQKGEKKEAKELMALIASMETFGKQSDKLLKRMSKANGSWLGEMLKAANILK